MAAHNSNKFKQIIVIIVGGGTKLTRAMFQYYVQKSSPSDQDPWTIDDFLHKNQRNILSTMTGKAKEHVFFPGFRKSTNLKNWDLQMYCFVLTELFSLSNEVRQDIKNLKQLRNKICHLSEPVISDESYDLYIDIIKGVVERCTQEIDDKDLKNEISQYIKAVESGTTDLSDAEGKLKEWYNFGKELRTYIYNLGPAQKEILQKVDTLIQGSTREMTEAIKIPESDVEIIVKNCTAEKEAYLSDFLVQLFSEHINQEPKINSELSDELLSKIRETVRNAMTTLLSGGRTLSNVERSSVILKIQCPSFRSLRELFESCSVLDIPFESLEKEIRKIKGCESAKLKVVISEETFWNCVNEIAIACEQYKERHSSLYCVTKEPANTDMHGRLIDVRQDESKVKSSVHLKIESNSPEHALYLKEVFKNGTADEDIKHLENAVSKALNLPKLLLEAKLTEGSARCSSEAGIPTDHLTLSLVPEAASLICRHAKVEQTSDDTTVEIIPLKTG